MTPDPAELQAHYLRCLHRYNDPPRGVDDRRLGEIELARAEHDLLEHPPPHKNESGVWVPRAKGLITADEARAGATPEGLAELESLEVPRGPRVRDDFKLIPKNELDDAFQQKKKDEALNRPFVKHGLDQDGVGSCASEGYSGCVMFCEEVAGQDVEPLSPWALYRLVNGGRDQGSSLSANVSAGAKFGIPTQKVWPRSKGWRERLSDEAKQDALKHRITEYWRVGSDHEMQTALILGFPVYFGYPGHAIFAVEYIDSRRFLYKNSWGDGWGDHGFASLRYSSIETGYGRWATRSTRRAA